MLAIFFICMAQCFINKSYLHGQPLIVIGKLTSMLPSFPVNFFDLPIK